MKKYTTAVVGSAVLALAVAGCSTKANESGGGGGGGGSDLKTDIGVSDDEIALGIQTDTTGAFKVTGLGLTNGNQMWAEDVNAGGGICGREIKLDIQDNGYKADNALPIYETQKTTNLGYLQLLGSPILAALKQKIISDKMVSVTASWASQNLDAPEVLMLGQTYDVEIINGLSWMQEQGMIGEGDKIGHIYVDSEYGQNGLTGSKYYAEQHGMTVVESAIAATDTDMTAVVAKMKDDGVKALAITVAPAATASIATQNVAQGLNVPILGSNPTFAPNMLQDQAVTAALSHYYQVNSILPFTTDNKFGKELAEKYASKFTDPPSHAVFAGYVAGMVWGEILEQACSDGDMTRDGILAAKSKVTQVNTEGLMGPLDLSKEGAPTSREAVIMQADASVADKGGLSVVAEFFESEDAKAYKAPFEK